ncbi:hypothetical protein A2U01_0016715 [Trifolium medium]|uniref:Uncharacterized protein n=1 Tax=Trifolium medium TaxID=97028 RepID=A0A392NB85_9FABA|nr:hypothetical protein [Trifolium medium]
MEEIQSPPPLSARNTTSIQHQLSYRSPNGAAIVELLLKLVDLLQHQGNRLHQVEAFQEKLTVEISMQILAIPYQWGFVPPPRKQLELRETVMPHGRRSRNPRSPSNITEWCHFHRCCGLAPATEVASDLKGRW